MVIILLMFIFYKVLQFLFLVIKLLKKIRLNIKKKRLEDYFNLYDLLKEIKEYHQKETNIIFCCEKLKKVYYNKLIIFGKTYDLQINKIIKINIKETNLLKSDFTEDIILISKNKEQINFTINIIYHMNNYYQIQLDKINNSLYLELVFYSKENYFPKDIKVNDIKIKDDYSINIPYLKRYNIINISRKDFINIYNKYSIEKIDENIKEILNTNNSLFINFIHKKDNNKYLGKIYEQNNDEKIEKDFNNEQLNLLKQIKDFISKILKDKKNLDNSSYIYNKYFRNIKIKNEIFIKEITNKIMNDHYFIKYYNKNIDNTFIELIEAGFFIEYTEIRAENGIQLYLEYIKEKEKIFINDYEFNNFEKLMILISLHSLIYNCDNNKLLRLYELPKISPFVQSEKIYLDVINELNEDSCLYFFFLQINSNSGFDYISLKTFYQIRFIPLIEIKTHLIFTRFRFCFIFKNKLLIPEFINELTLINNFNIEKTITGYRYKNSLELEENDDITTKLLFFKVRENSKLKLNLRIYKNNSFSKYFYDYDLNIISTHSDTPIKYKYKKVFNYLHYKTNEHYLFETFLLSSFRRVDKFLGLNGNVMQLISYIKLLSGNLLDLLNDIIPKTFLWFVEKNKDNGNKGYLL